MTTTLHAMGVFSEHHPLSMHMLGMHGAAYANYAIQEADLIVAIGSRFDDRTTGALAQYAPEASPRPRPGRLFLFSQRAFLFYRRSGPTPRGEAASSTLTLSRRSLGTPRRHLLETS